MQKMAMSPPSLHYLSILVLLLCWMQCVTAKGAAAAAAGGEGGALESEGEKPHRWVIWLVAIVPGVMILFVVGFCIPYHNMKSAEKFKVKLDELINVEGGSPMPSNPINGKWTGSYTGARDKAGKYPKAVEWNIEFSDDGKVTGEGKDDRGAFIICGYTDAEKATWVQFYNLKTFTKSDSPHESLQDCMTQEEKKGFFGRAFEMGTYQAICSTSFAGGGKRFVRGEIISNSGYEGEMRGDLSPDALEAAV